MPYPYSHTCHPCIAACSCISSCSFIVFICVFQTECPNPSLHILDFAEGTLDDQYTGCENETQILIESLYLPAELEENLTFRTAWEEAKTATGNQTFLRGVELTAEQAAAIHLFTEGGFHCDFNTAVRSGGNNYTAFPFKALHYYLTTALKKLKLTQDGCYDVFMGIKKPSNVAAVGQIVRFGEFTSSFLRKEAAGRFWNRTVLKIRTCQGVLLGNDSLRQREEEKDWEVVIPPFERFEVASMRGNGSRITLKLTGDMASVYNCSAGKER
ncbi:erythroblast NAD(P)(+)--arginine ADP-ribosyltransferase-like [Huso huso]|uniref:NAD(P)(+)--arginine ADP-ribosyltransferase n=1 Tax=Huso huso TaxID=61971 RepID=A0ABR0YFY4_HUSHU